VYPPNIENSVSYGTRFPSHDDCVLSIVPIFRIATCGRPEAAPELVLMIVHKIMREKYKYMGSMRPVT